MHAGQRDAERLKQIWFLKQVDCLKHSCQEKLEKSCKWSDLNILLFFHLFKLQCFPLQKWVDVKKWFLYSKIKPDSYFVSYLYKSLYFFCTIITTLVWEVLCFCFWINWNMLFLFKVLWVTGVWKVIYK